MNITTEEFQRAAFVALQDVKLQGALEGATYRFTQARHKAFAALPDADLLRDHFKQIRAATLSRLADYLEQFEQQATAAGAQLHWAEDGAAACRIVLEIAQRHGAELAVKSKSMATEEIELNRALQRAGIVPVETDLGEWLIQLAHQPPSHIIAPAIHLTRQQAATLLSREAGHDLDADDIPALTATARQLLREKFLSAGIGISGGNLAIAETGSLITVTNEGNGRLVSSAPPVHVAIIGIEKIAPDWQAAAVWLSLLARSATGQAMSIYTNIITGPARSDDPDGPQEVHIILLDNGRSQLIGTEYEEILQCIRCGACLNVCPVYREAGGHAYHSPYSGPIGAVISPLLFGLESYSGLPQASSLCGACRDICPVRIDIPRMLLALRADMVEQKIVPFMERLLEEGVATLLLNEQVMEMSAGILRLLQKPFLNNTQLTHGRQLPQLARQSFRQWWKENGEV